METIYLGIVVFLFLLAIFDLTVGVSNDAVNFLNSAIGAKAAKFRTIIIVAAIGILCGATMSNGMMDIARHGIFLPDQFSFYELMCIFLAVMVTDVVLLDIFNSLGMPTSTTVSMVFELLGGAFVLALIKIAGDTTGLLDFGSLLNTEKALSVIMSIFLSVAIAFVFGVVVQWLSRLIFSFNYKKNLKWTIGIFGGIAVTSLVYFMLIKGLKGASFITPDVKEWISQNTLYLVGICFVFFALLAQLLHALKVNVFKVVVLLGTFALAMAFAGNDLVNFIGVPLAGFSAYTDFTANGNGDVQGFMMSSLNESAKTPFIFLLIAGIIMIISLVKSKKAQNVVKTSVGLSRQDEGDEMFGSSVMARSLVRSTTNLSNTVNAIMPAKMRHWIDSRFNKEEVIMEEDAAFDMVRASVNLVLAGLLIVMGTSLKLPLSTTYVAFMVAMGTSLADRAWNRESAVFRITGVISVIGGWFLTAGAAFMLCALVALVMYYGGTIAMIAMIVIAVILLIRSNRAFAKKSKEAKEDDIFVKMMNTKDKGEALMLLNQHVNQSAISILNFTIDTLEKATNGLIFEDLKMLRKTVPATNAMRDDLKKRRRKEILGMKRVNESLAIEKNTWIYLCSNSCEQMLFCLRHIEDPCKEHVDNNFNPLPEHCIKEYLPIRDCITAYLERGIEMIKSENFTDVDKLLDECDNFKDNLSELRKKQLETVRIENGNVKISLVYLTILQESQEIITALRHLLRARSNFQN